MNTQEEANTTTTTGTSESPITFSDNGTNVTITIQGAAFANLRKVANTMNAMDWCDTDNSPLTIVRNFALGDLLADFAENPQSISSDILSVIDAGFEDGTPEDKARIAELRAAFERAGLL